MSKFSRKHGLLQVSVDDCSESVLNKPEYKDGVYTFASKRNKTQQIAFAVTDEQHKVLEIAAHANQMTMAEYCRSVLFAEQPPLGDLHADFLRRLPTVEHGTSNHEVMTELLMRGLVREVVPNGTEIGYEKTIAGKVQRGNEI